MFDRRLSCLLGQTFVYAPALLLTFRTRLRLALRLVLPVILAGVSLAILLEGLAQPRVAHAISARPLTAAEGSQAVLVLAPPPAPVRAPNAAPLLDVGGPSVVTVCQSTCPYNNVQLAVRAVAPNGLVKVAQGVYTDVGGDVVQIMQSLTLRGGYTITDWSVANPVSYPTILDGGSARRVIYIDGVAARVEGFHIRNGYVADYGGGIYIAGTSNPTITANSIHDNSATGGGGRGGGIYIYDGSAVVQDNEISTNTATLDGGGLYIQSGSSSIEDNQIYNNKANTGNTDDGGGGVYVSNGSPTLRRNEIHDNVAGNNNNCNLPGCSGGGLHILNGTVTVESNAIHHNKVGSGGAGYRGGGIHVGNGNQTIQNNLIYNNSAVNGGGIYVIHHAPTVQNNTVYGNTGHGIYDYGEGSSPVIRNNVVISNTNSGIERGGSSLTVDYNDASGNGGGGNFVNVSGTGNTTVDPLLVNPGVDFHLQADSPARDAADPTSDNYPANDYDGVARPLGARADIGAFEYYTGTCFAQVSSVAPATRVFTNVQEAVYTAADNALVKVSGVCTGTVNLTHALTLRGGYSLTEWTTPITRTILDGRGVARAVYITGTGVVTVDGLLICNGYADYGGGIYIAKALSPTIQNVVFYSNSASYGGGLASAGGNPRIYNNTFVSNTATYSGGAAYFGAGFPAVSNTIVASSTKSGGLFATSNATLTLDYNDFWGNTGGNYTSTFIVLGAHNIFTDPLFVSFAQADFHLQTKSPCLHAADPNTALAWDWEGDARPQGHRSDIGADESAAFPNVSLTPYSENQGIPGRSTLHVHTLQNNGTLISDTFDLTHTFVFTGRSGTGLSWTVSYTPVFTLALGESAAVSVTVGVPSGAISDDIGIVILTATSRYNPTAYGVVSNSTVISWNTGVRIAPTYATQVNPGTVVTYAHTLSNTGNHSDTFKIRLITSKSWAYLTPTQDINLDPNMTATLWVRVTTPLTAVGGLMETTVVTASSLSEANVMTAVTDTTTVNQVAGARHVAVTGDDTLNNCLVPGLPCLTIAYAVGQALSGDAVKVAAGAYNEHDVLLNKPVTLSGGYTTTNSFASYNPTVNHATIDAGGGGRVIYIFGSPTVEGLTLRGGLASGSGGGIYVSLGAPTIRQNNIISNTAESGGGVYINRGLSQVISNTLSGNTARSDGGGLYVKRSQGSSAVEVWQNTIVGNAASGSGGGVYNDEALTTLRQNSITSNTAGVYGGGVYNSVGNPVVEQNDLAFNTADLGAGFANGAAGGSGSPDFWNNMVYANRAGTSGGGVYVVGGSPRIWHDTIYSNTANQGGGVFLSGDGVPVIKNTIVVSNTAIITGGGVYSQAMGAALAYNDVWGNVKADYVGASGGDFSLSSDPFFWNAAMWNLHLQGDSLCIDHGGSTTLANDRDGNPRPLGPAPDIGADEYQRAGVDLAPDSFGSGYPGNTITYTHVITNTGSDWDVFSFSHFASPGWTVNRPAAMSLGPGLTTTVQVLVTIPSNAISGTVETAVITATSTNPMYQPSDVVRDTTTVSATYGVIFEFDQAGNVNSNPGAPASIAYAQVLTNTGNYTDSFVFTPTSRLGFTVTVAPTSPSVGPGRSTLVTVTVTAPPTGTSNLLIDTAIVTATSKSDSSKADPVAITTFVNRWASAQLSPGSDKTASPGAQIEFTHALTNVGNYTDTFDFTPTSRHGWIVAPILPVTLGPSQTEMVYVYLTVSSGATCYEKDTVIITATSQFSPTARATAVNTATASSVAQLTLAPTRTVNVNSIPSLPVSVVYTHTLTNSGNCTATISLTAVRGTPGFTATLFPSSLPDLPPRVTQTVYVTVTVPATTTANLLVDRTTVTATGPSVSDAIVDTTIVNQVAGVNLSTGSAQSGTPGSALDYFHTLTNTGNYTDTFHLALAGLGSIVGPVDVQVGKDMTATVQVQSSVPDQLCGAKLYSTLSAQSLFNQAVSTTAVNTMTVLHNPAVDIAPVAQTVYTNSNALSTVPVRYLHSLTNMGNCTDTFTLTVQSSYAGFTAIVLPVTRNLVRGESAPVYVTVTVPVTTPAYGNLMVDTALVTATSQANLAVLDVSADTTVVNKWPRVELAPDNTTVITQPYVTSDPIEVIYAHQLTNTGNYTDDFAFVVASSSGWAVTPPNAVYDLGQGQMTPVYPRVYVPANVYTATDRTVVTVTSPFSPAVRAMVVNTTTVRRPHVTLAPNYSRDANPESLVTYLHTVTNSGGIADTYTITYTEDLGWAVTVTPTTIYLLPGNAARITATVTVSRTGANQLIITATSQTSDLVLASVADQTRVAYQPDARLAPNNTQSSPPDHEVYYTHVLTNMGNYTETFDLTALSELGYAEVTPSVVSLGPSGVYTPIQVIVSIPAFVASGVTDTTIIRATSRYTSPQITREAFDYTLIQQVAGRRYVSPDGVDTNNNCSSLDYKACATVQHAVDMAQPGDRVLIAGGVYSDVHSVDGMLQVVRVSKSVSLTGGYATTNWNTSDPAANPTALDAGGQGRVIYITGNITPTIEGLHLRGGSASDGAGLYITTGSTPTVRLNLVYSNTATGQGGGIYFGGGGNPTFDRNTIYTNTAANGGGVYIVNGSPRVWNNVIYRNGVTGSGGGLYYDAGNSPTLWNNTVYSNTASIGGGLYLTGTGSPVVSNTIVAGNTGYGVYAKSGVVVDYGNLSGNMPGDYGGGVTGGAHNVYSDPRLVNPSGGNFHLRGGSPAIDAGDPNSVLPDVDREGNHRPLLIRHDIGAYEYGPTSVKRVASPDTAPGAFITYTIAVTNTGNTAFTILITDTLHPYLDYAGVMTWSVGSGQYLTSTRTISWTGDVAGGYASASITFTARITSWVAPGMPITNVAWVDSARTNVVTTTVNSTPIVGVRYVATTGRDQDNSCRISWQPCATPQRAADQAVTGDDVWIAAGVYTPGAGQVVSVTKSITLTGGYTTSWTTPDPIANPTYLDGQESAGVVVISGTGGTTVKLSGFKIMNSNGDGVRVITGSLSLDRTWVYSNTGNGLDVGAGSAFTLTNNVIARNTLAGLQTASGSAGQLRHTTFARNGTGAAISGTVRLTNTIFYSHSVGVNATGGAVYLYNTLWHSNTVNAGTPISSANVYGDPRFVNPDGVDYHLRGDSAALGLGAWANVAQDVDGDARPTNLVDIGADQYPLRLARAVTPTVAPLCAQVSHTLALTNLRATPLAGVSFTDTLDWNASFAAGDTVVASAGNASYVAASRAITWIGNISAGGAVYITYTAHVTPYLSNGTLLSFTATISDPVSMFSTSPASVTATTQPASLSKSGPATTTIGEAVTYTVVFTVPAGHVAYQPVVSDTLPRLMVGGTGAVSTTPALTYVMGSLSVTGAFTLTENVASDGGAITWRLSTITASCSAPQVVVFTLQAQVRDLADNNAGDALTNTITLSYTEATAAGWLRDNTVTQQAALVEPQVALTQTVTPAANLGSRDRVTVTLVVSNTGASVLYDLAVSDTLPAELVFEDASPGYSVSGQVVTWTAPSVGPGVQRVLTITARVVETIGAHASLINTADASGSSLPGAVSGERVYTSGAIQATATTGYPSLVISKERGPAVRSPGQFITYTIRYTNTGLVRALDVVVADTLPLSVTNVLSLTSAAATVERVGQMVTWTLSTPVSRSVGGAIWVTATVDLATQAGTMLTNTAGITTSTSQVSTIDTAWVTTTVRLPSLTIGKTAREAVLPGGLLTYTLTISDTGLGDALSLGISDTVPLNTTYLSCLGGDACGESGSVVTWTVPLVTAGSRTQVTLTVRVPDDITFGTILTNQAFGVVALQGVSATGAPITTSVGLTGTIELEPFAISRTVQAGQATTFTHILTNNYNVSQSLIVTATSSHGHGATVTPKTTAILPAYGGSTVVTVTVTVPSGAISGTVDTTIVTATGDLGGSDIATEQITVGLRPEVSLSPASQYRSVYPSQNAVYTHTLTNRGNTTATFNLAASTTPEWSFVWQPQAANLAPNASATIVLTVTAPAGVGQTVTAITTSWPGLPSFSATAVDTTTIGCVPVSTVDFVYSPAAPAIGQVVTFTGTASPANITAPITFTWELGDGAQVTQGSVATTLSVVSHTYSDDRSYNVRLTAASLCGTAQKEQTVVVNPHRIYLPVVLRSYPPPTKNLTVSDILVTPADAPATRVVIKNMGNVNITEAFWVVLYLDPTSAVQINKFWYDAGCQNGIVWYINTPLAAGQSRTLMLAEAYSSPYTQWVDSFRAGTHSVWAQVDAYAGAGATGLVQEANEGDNMRGPVTFTP